MGQKSDHALRRSILRINAGSFKIGGDQRATVATVSHQLY